MNEISVVTNRSFGRAKDYLTLLYELDDSLCCGYGAGFPRKYIFSDEPKEKMLTPRVSNYVRYMVVNPMCKLIGKPQYYSFISNVKLLDEIFANKVSKDDSKIVCVSPLMYRTIIACKKAKKIIVSVAENSEPIRECKRIVDDYKKYGINHRYIYGDEKWEERIRRGLDASDKIITISKVSQKTYYEAGFDDSVFKLIPKNGTDMPSKSDFVNGKKRAFITTAFHCFIKGTHRLLLAWKKANVQNIPLVIVGRLCEDMEEFINKYGPFENVIFEGHRSDLGQWYLDWDAVGVLMSLSEGGSKVIAEMMSFGFPMLVSPDATCDLVVDGQNGFIVDPYDVDMLAGKIKWISENWYIVNKMKEYCFSSIEAKTMSGWSKEVAEYLKSLI